MNLVVASRHEGPLMRFEVEGRWQSGDALKLAYFIKAAVARAREAHVLVDLTRVKARDGEPGKFLICDRLRRALGPNTRIGLVGATDLVDAISVPQGFVHCPDIAVFDGEPEARTWLKMRSVPAPRPASASLRAAQ